MSLENNTPKKKLKVALICMPFYVADRPSIQIGLLNSIATQAGHDVDNYHLNLELAAKLGTDIFDEICCFRRPAIGEWLFSDIAFDQCSNDNQEFFDRFPRIAEWLSNKFDDYDTNWLTDIKNNIIPKFIDHCMNITAWGNYDLIGFTSTFQQNVASLALARRLKQNYPTTGIIFGGANMEREMGYEYLHKFSYIDYVAIGEADISFPLLLDRISHNQADNNIPGIACRTEDGLFNNGQSLPYTELDLQPTPDYSDYFARASKLGLLDRQDYFWAIPFESSRGCWWGRKHHCSFCGLNGQGMAYREKNPDTILQLLTELAKSYRKTQFEATDNIMSMDYINKLFTRIKEDKQDFRFFYEIKSNLTRKQIQTLHQGGVHTVQPGIESLNTRILKLMNKGVTMLQNVRLLKWCRYYNIRVCWNLLWGIPGETQNDYEQELGVLKLLTHLEPPGGAGRIWIERFSPYFSNSCGYNIKNILPDAWYAYIYPKEINSHDIAYFFDADIPNTLPDAYHKDTGEWVTLWREKWNSEKSDSLTYRNVGDTVFIDESRQNMEAGQYSFNGPMAKIYTTCTETMHSTSYISKNLNDSGYDVNENYTREALNYFCQLGLMIQEDDQYLSLALPCNSNW